MDLKKIIQQRLLRPAPEAPELPELLGVAVCGGREGEARHHAIACEGIQRASLKGFWLEDAEANALRAEAWSSRAYGNYESVLADPEVNIVALLDPMSARTDRALAALEAGKHVMLGAPFASDSGQAKWLADAAARSESLLMSYENRFFYPPAAKIIEMIEKNVIGRVSSIRMRSLIAGAGGWDEYLNPGAGRKEKAPVDDPARFVFREIFEKLSFARRILGPIEEIFTYGIAPGGKPGRTVTLTWKHRAPGTYGVLDITFAPLMNIRSATEPRDDNMEITGSAGVIWLTGECSQIRKEPLVRVYRVDARHDFCCLEGDWQKSYDRCTAHFVECILTGEKPSLDPKDGVSAVECANAATRSAETSHRVRI